MRLGTKDLLPTLILLAAWATGDSFLVDSDTGWHIRAGDLARGASKTGSSFAAPGEAEGASPLPGFGAEPQAGRGAAPSPRQEAPPPGPLWEFFGGDPFSFSAGGRAWFAWEWLADLGMSALHERGGLGWLVNASALCLALSFGLAQRLALRLGASSFLALGVCLLGAAASSVHWLARPHLLSMPMAAAFVWVLESGRPGRSPWPLSTLPLLMAAWCNLHGAFPVGWALIGAYLIGGLLPGSPERWRPRDLALSLAACCAATLLNPYGLELHRHLLAYLSSPEILGNIEEFRSPDFSKGSAVFLEAWLALAALCLIRMVSCRDWARILALLGLVHMSLTSHRHVTLLVVCSTPWLASALEPGAWLRRLEALEAGHTGRWGLLLAPALLWALGPAADRFSASVFPVDGVEALLKTQATRVLCTDAFGGYVLYRAWPRLRVFVDGRSDFYAEAGVFRDELAMLELRPGWVRSIEAYAPDSALLPRGSPIAAWLLATGRWRQAYEDAVCVLLMPAAR